MRLRIKGLTTEMRNHRLESRFAPAAILENTDHVNDLTSIGMYCLVPVPKQLFQVWEHRACNRLVYV